MSFTDSSNAVTEQGFTLQPGAAATASSPRIVHRGRSDQRFVHLYAILLAFEWVVFGLGHDIRRTAKRNDGNSRRRDRCAFGNRAFDRHRTP